MAKEVDLEPEKDMQPLSREAGFQIAFGNQTIFLPFRTKDG